MALDRVTSPTDSLVAALRAALEAVDVVVCIRGVPEMCPCCRSRASAEGRASIPALAAAVQEWIKGQLANLDDAVCPGGAGWGGSEVGAYADVAVRLGL